MTAPTQQPIRMGLDENGLGPLLGPMIVTAVAARVNEAGHKLASKPAKGALAKRLGDSKAMVAHGDIALGEAWAKAIAARAKLSFVTPDELIHALALDTKKALRAPCPPHVESQCWATTAETFAPDTTLENAIATDLDKLSAKGLDVCAARVVIVCNKRINEAADRGQNRFVLDLHAMERMVLDLRTTLGGPVRAVCGKVGGFKEYSNQFGPLGGRLHTVIQEEREKSIYRFPGLGDIEFVQDSDASDLLVAMASMIGKYARELLMARIVSHYQGMNPELPVASGYHDPVTTRFVEATALLRREHNVPDDCFTRRKVGR
jgi:ribonuclease HII